MFSVVTLLVSLKNDWGTVSYEGGVEIFLSYQGGVRFLFILEQVRFKVLCHRREVLRSPIMPGRSGGFVLY